MRQPEYVFAKWGGWWPARFFCTVGTPVIIKDGVATPTTILNANSFVLRRKGRMVECAGIFESGRETRRRMIEKWHKECADMVQSADDMVNRNLKRYEELFEVKE